MEPIPLVENTPLVLLAWGEADDQRFAALFAQAWKRLPVEVTETLLHYWGKWMFSDTISPTIELLETWSDNTDSEDKPIQTFGMCTLLGNEIRFRAEAVDAMPEIYAQTLIAHELSHVFLYAQGVRKRQEQKARKLTAEWGFDQLGLDQWMKDFQRSQFRTMIQAVQE